MYMSTDYIQNMFNNNVHEINYVNMCARDSKSNPRTSSNGNDSLKN